MKKTLMILGGVFLVIVIAAIIGFTVMATKGNALDEESKTYIDKVVPIILSDLRQETLLKYSSAELKNSATPEEFNKLFKWFENLGEYNNFIDSKGQSKINYSNEHGKVISANYFVETEFENGPATVTVGIVKRNEQWLIYNFRINSSALITD